MSGQKIIDGLKDALSDYRAICANRRAAAEGMRERAAEAAYRELMRDGWKPSTVVAAIRALPIEE